MRKSMPVSFEFLYQVSSLILIVIVVHAVYAGVVRPRADVILAAQQAAMKTGGAEATQRSVYVVIRDYEQEACFVLMFWALALMAYKSLRVFREGSLLQEDLIPLAEDMRILPEDTRRLSRHLQALPDARRRALLPRALLVGLQRFDATGSIQDVAGAIQFCCTAEAERLDSELSMIRYIAWAIPSIGFIGTVRGIGEALGQAYKAVEGDIFGVTRSLGVAFNSTLIALLISIVLMFLLHQLQHQQERYVLNTEAYCEEKLTRHLRPA